MSTSIHSIRKSTKTENTMNSLNGRFKAAHGSLLLTTTKTYFSVINKFTEKTCIWNISDNKDAIYKNLSE